MFDVFSLADCTRPLTVAFTPANICFVSEDSHKLRKVYGIRQLLSQSCCWMEYSGTSIKIGRGSIAFRLGRK